MRSGFPLLGAFAGAFGFLHTIPGPEFLVLYAFWLIVLWLVVLVLRRRGFDSPLTTTVGLVMFEGLGLLRMAVGSAHGMHKWLGLVVMMIIGALFFLLRVQNSDSGSGSGSSGGGCSGGSSCGGGGSGCGGGGGCGGCGGS